MKTLIIAILILIIAPLELLATVASLGIYIMVMDESLSSRLVDKL